MSIRETSHFILPGVTPLGVCGSLRMDPAALPTSPSISSRPRTSATVPVSSPSLVPAALNRTRRGSGLLNSSHSSLISSFSNEFPANSHVWNELLHIVVHTIILRRSWCIWALMLGFIETYPEWVGWRHMICLNRPQYRVRKTSACRNIREVHG